MLELVFLNACKSYRLGQALIKNSVPYVVCWKTKTCDNACIHLMSEFEKFLNIFPRKYGFSWKLSLQEFQEVWILQAPDNDQNRHSGVPTLLWNDTNRVDIDWIPGEGLSGEYPRTGTVVNETPIPCPLRNWRELQGDDYYSSLAGKAERAALAALGFKLLLDGKEIGLEMHCLDAKSGFLTAAALCALCVNTFKEL